MKWLRKIALLAAFFAINIAQLAVAAEEAPKFSRHVTAVLSRAGCNGGTCHGAVQGKNGFRLSLFAADPKFDFEQIVRGTRGRRVNFASLDNSLLLSKPSGRVPHGGGVVLEETSEEYRLLYRWLAAGAPRDSIGDSQLLQLHITPASMTIRVGDGYRVRVTAQFADGTTEDVTELCTFESKDDHVATVDNGGHVRAVGVGDTALLIRYRGDPTIAMVAVPQTLDTELPKLTANNEIDKFVLAKLARLQLPSAQVCDDATFLRRISLDIAGRLPRPDEVRAFLADNGTTKRQDAVERLLASEQHVDLWTLKFCDLLKASDFGVYADAIDGKSDSLRFQAWLRARLSENLPYDELAARILTATSREGRSLEAWQAEVTGLFEHYTAERRDLALYAKRRTPDLYWQRKNATGVDGAMQVAHAFLGLRLECARCHRHPHDTWQQDDLLSFANFFVRLRGTGFNGQHEKQFPDVAKIYAKLKEQGKQLEQEAKEQTGEGNKLKQEANRLKQDVSRLVGEIARLDKQLADAQSPNEALQSQRTAKQREHDEKRQTLADKNARVDAIAELKRRSKYVVEVGRRMMHAEIMHYGESAKDKFATVTSPLGTQSSREFRLLGSSEAIRIPPQEDPREHVAKWLSDPQNPYFARAITNRIWAHYFGRGIVDPPDDLSSLNPATHPELLDHLANGLVDNDFDLRWLHRQILQSRTYQQSTIAPSKAAVDRTNYARFYLRRLPAEVILDALDDATGTREDFSMNFWKWPTDLRAIEIPYPPEQNAFVSFMLENFGRPQRNAAIQCDCERVGDSSILQSLSLANHPRVLAKIKAPEGRAAAICEQFSDNTQRVEEVFLVALSRLPTPAEMAASIAYVEQSSSPLEGIQGVLWGLINTKEFILQH